MYPQILNNSEMLIPCVFRSYSTLKCWPMVSSDHNQLSNVDHRCPKIITNPQMLIPGILRSWPTLMGNTQMLIPCVLRSCSTLKWWSLLSSDHDQFSKVNPQIITNSLIVILVVLRSWPTLKGWFMYPQILTNSEMLIPRSCSTLKCWYLVSSGHGQLSNVDHW